MTIKDKIIAVQKAIQETLLSQSLTSQSGTVARAELKTLTDYEDRLLAQYMEEKSWAQGGFINRVRFR